MTNIHILSFLKSYLLSILIFAQIALPTFNLNHDNFCASLPCGQNGDCIRTSYNGYQCICHIPYEGDHCERRIDYCQQGLHQCQSTGECISDITALEIDRPPFYECECLENYEGQFCEKSTDPCVSVPCQHDGYCQLELGGGTRYLCVCPAGWTGNHCEKEVDGCGSNPCQNGAPCISQGLGSYRCECQPPFNPPNCETKDLQCLKNPSPCFHGGICGEYDREPYFLCDCQDGYRGKDCSHIPRVCSSAPCQNEGVCINNQGKIICECKKGFSGEFCEINEDECQSSPCSKKSQDNTCNDGPGRWECSCSDKWTGIDCGTEVSHCQNNSTHMQNQVCINGGQCIDTDDFPYIECGCPYGYEGRYCELDIWECGSLPCQNGAECYEHEGLGIGSYDCKCDPGYTGVHCEIEIDWCISNPCQNLGICDWHFNMYICTCEPGWTGVHCELDIDECQSSPCAMGSCTNLLDEWKCTCYAGWEGDTCDTNHDDCASNPCFNGATCEDQVGAFTCWCVEGFTGVVCEDDIDECASQPCIAPGSHCHNLIDEFKCDCPDGISEFSNNKINDTFVLNTRCDHEIDECASNPCYNGAICQDGMGDYDCICQLGYYGNNCETIWNYCDSERCLKMRTTVERPFYVLLFSSTHVIDRCCIFLTTLSILFLVKTLEPANNPNKNTGASANPVSPASTVKETSTNALQTPASKKIP